TLHNTEGVKISDLVTSITVCGYEMQYANLASFMLSAYSTCTNFLDPRTIFGFQKKMFANSFVRHFCLNVVFNAGEFVKVNAPIFWNRIGVSQVRFVQFINIGGVVSSEM